MKKEKGEADMAGREKRNRILIAGAKSGSGKTSVVCAVLAAFRKRGMRLAACKCGPDYIDPLFHEKILGVPSENIDLFFHDAETQKKLFCRHTKGAELTVIEGVMGYYDGRSFSDLRGSSCEIAEKLDIPVVLILPCRGMGHSVIPFLKGFLEYRNPSKIRGIILNEVSGASYERLAPVLKNWLSENGHTAKLLGYLPRLPEIVLKSRHLGLVLPEELAEIRRTLEVLAEQAEKTVCLEQLLEIAGEAPDFTADFTPDFTPEQEEGKGTPDVKAGAARADKKKRIRIAAARDEAFCFYYKDNLELLREMGCEICWFSPLHGEALPEGTDGVILAGGYPELYAAGLSENKGMLQDIRKKLLEGLPCLAECGGFLYLKEELEAEDGSACGMVGFLEGKGFCTGKLSRFGYIEIEAKETNPFLEKGKTIRGHEFHYWDCTKNGAACTARKPDGIRQWDCIEIKGNVFAGFPHLSFYSEPEFAENFVKLCRKEKEKRNAGKNERGAEAERTDR